MIPSRRERRKNERKTAKELSAAPTVAPGSKYSTKALIVLSLIIAVAATVFIAEREREKHMRASPETSSAGIGPAAVTPLPVSAPSAAKLTLGRLLDLKPDELARMDLAEMNLLCATDLAGSENLDIHSALKTLDEWARIAERQIARNQHRFDENPAEYERSENLFKMVMLVLTIQQDLHVHYDPAMMGTAVKPDATRAEIERDLADNSYFKNAASVFLTGILSQAHTGTCSSLPVLYAAIGRRLGFPLKLVASKCHLFNRWDDGRERFNVEGTSGANSLSDEYYKNWPLPLNQAEIESGEYLKSFSPTEELAVFLEMRSCCLRASGRYDDAMVALAQAYRLDPKGVNRKIGLAKVAEVVTAVLRPPTPSHPPNDALAEIKRVVELNRANREQLEKMRLPGNVLSNPPGHFPRQNPPAAQSSHP